MGCFSDSYISEKDSVNNNYDRSSIISRASSHSSNVLINENILNDFRDKLLKKHNELRKKHKAYHQMMN